MEYDAIVVGGGHAGIEACLALSRMGFETLLVTRVWIPSAAFLQPAVGGLAKGIWSGVDALGG
jgi:tRNA uridine 5-carboxymethylaminomethyl modification enzyme